jgi:hypothetical protein
LVEPIDTNAAQETDTFTSSLLHHDTPAQAIRLESTSSTYRHDSDIAELLRTVDKTGISPCKTDVDLLPENCATTPVLIKGTLGEYYWKCPCGKRPDPQAWERTFNCSRCNINSHVKCHKSTEHLQDLKRSKRLPKNLLCDSCVSGV